MSTYTSYHGVTAVVVSSIKEHNPEETYRDSYATRSIAITLDSGEEIEINLFASNVEALELIDSGTDCAVDSKQLARKTHKTRTTKAE